MARGLKTGGRRAGTLNKATIERLEKARIAEQIVSGGKPEKLASDVLREFMELFADIARIHQPRPAAQGTNPQENEGRFDKYARLAVECAKALAPYQSPTFKSIAVTAPPPGPLPKTAEGDVIDINDPVALMKVWERRVIRVRG
jgi:hypothetical protein